MSRIRGGGRRRPAVEADAAGAPTPVHVTRPDGDAALLPRWARQVAGVCIVALLVAATAWLLIQLLWWVPLVLYSLAATILLAALLTPLVDKLAGRGRFRWLAALLAELGLIALIVTTLVVVYSRASAQFENLEARTNQALARLEELLSGPPLNLSEQRFANLRDQLVGALEELAPGNQAYMTLALDVLTAVAIVVFVLFFLLKDGPQMWDWALGWAPDRHAAAVDDVGRTGWETLTGYVRGMVVVALFDAALIGASLFVFGVPLALSLSVLVFLGAFIPIAGAVITGALAVAVTAVTVGVWQALVVLAVVLLVQQLEGNVLQPLVIGNAVSLHPVVIILAVTVGGLVDGIGGAVVAVPLVAVLYRMTAEVIGPDSLTRGDRAHVVRSDESEGGS